MAETYTHTTWRVKPGLEDEFIRCWKEGSSGATSRGSARGAAPARRREFADVRELRPLDEHRCGEELARGGGHHERVARLQQLLEGFEPRTLDVVAEG